MKSIKNLVAVTTLSIMSFGAFAQSVTTYASTINGAEAQIVAQAKKAGATYKITEPNFNNGVHITAELTK